MAESDSHRLDISDFHGVLGFQSTRILPSPVLILCSARLAAALPHTYF
jgi:hypothetical protein